MTTPPTTPTTRRGALTGTTMRAPTDADVSLAVSATAVNTQVTSPTLTPSTEQDSAFVTASGGVHDVEYDLTVTPTYGADTPADVKVLTYQSMDMAIGTLTGTHVNRVADGTVGILVKSGRNWRTVRKDMTLSRVNEATVKTFANYVAGSAALAATNTIDNLIAGLEGTSDELLLQVAGARNPLCWLDTNLLAATSIGHPRLHAITSRLVAIAKHYPTSNGTWWEPTTGTAQTRTVVDYVDIGGALANPIDPSKDIRIGLLDSDLPTTITPFALMSSGWLDYLPGYANRIPVVTVNQFHQVLVRDWAGTTYRPYGATGDCIGLVEPTDATRQKFYLDYVGDDSSSPLILLFGSTPVLLTHTVVGGAGGGPIYSDNLTAIQDAIDTLNGRNGI